MKKVIPIISSLDHNVTAVVFAMQALNMKIYKTMNLPLLCIFNIGLNKIPSIHLSLKPSCSNESNGTKNEGNKNHNSFLTGKVI